MKKENSSVEAAAILTGTDLTVARAKRLVAIQQVCNSLLAARDPEECFALLTENLSQMDNLNGGVPAFVTGQYFFYRDALAAIDEAIAQKRTEISSVIQPKSEKLRRVRERLQIFGSELKQLVEPKKESSFRYAYDKFWSKDVTDMSLINLRIQRMLTCRFPALRRYIPAAENFFAYCFVKKRCEILSETERLLSYISSDEKLINEALDTLEGIRDETERLKLGTFAEPLDELCDLLNRNFDEIYEELTVILLHPSFTQQFDSEGATALNAGMEKLERIQMEVENLQTRFDELEEQASNREIVKNATGLTARGFCL